MCLIHTTDRPTDAPTHGPMIFAQANNLGTPILVYRIRATPKEFYSNHSTRFDLVVFISVYRGSWIEFKYDINIVDVGIR